MDKGKKYPEILRILVERAPRRAFTERAQGDSGLTRALHLATLTQFRNSELIARANHSDAYHPLQTTRKKPGAPDPERSAYDLAARASS